MTNDVHTDAPETIDALRTVLLLMDGDPDAVIAAAKQRCAESKSFLDSWWMPEYTEEDCIRDALRAAIMDAYFGPMAPATAATLRDALGEYGTVCIDPRCPSLTYHSWEVANQYNARHPGSEIDTHCTGYVPFEI